MDASDAGNRECLSSVNIKLSRETQIHVQSTWKYITAKDTTSSNFK